MTEDDIAEVRAVAASRGFALLKAAMLERRDGELREMYVVDTSDERRREIAVRQAGRDDVLGWFGEVIQRGG